VIAPESADANIYLTCSKPAPQPGKVCFFAPIQGSRKRELLVSKKKKSLDYTTGTYFIQPDIIEEMRQKQRQQRQLVTEQGKEQQSTDPGKQATPMVLELPDTTLTQTTQN
jgi:hypothetical protein